MERGGRGRAGRRRAASRLSLFIYWLGKGSDKIEIVKSKEAEGGKIVEDVEINMKKYRINLMYM